MYGRRPLSEVPRERLAGLPVFAAALRCVPYVMPSQWAENPALLADELCLLTIHADSEVRRVRCSATTSSARTYNRPT